MKKKSIAIIAILCIMSMLIAFGACQKGGDEDTLIFYNRFVN